MPSLLNKVLEIKNNLLSAISENKYKKIIVFLGLGGILIIFASDFFKKPENKTLDLKENEKISAEKYVDNLQKSLESIV